MQLEYIISRRHSAVIRNMANGSGYTSHLQPIPASVIQVKNGLGLNTNMQNRNGLSHTVLNLNQNSLNVLNNGITKPPVMSNGFKPNLGIDNRLNQNDLDHNTGLNLLPGSLSLNPFNNIQSNLNSEHSLDASNVLGLNNGANEVVNGYNVDHLMDRDSSPGSNSSSSPELTSVPSPSNSQKSSSSSSSSSSSNNSKRKGVPYIPSYMDLSNGPEPCIVCSDAATGYHYRCMTCEGCKGFFRRTIQKNLQYSCKWNSACVIDKTTRNQCQECRFRKCLVVGMTPDLVLNEKQRVAKRKLIEDNRDRRLKEDVKLKTHSSSCGDKDLSDSDRALIHAIVLAYELTNMKVKDNYAIPQCDNHEEADPEVWQRLAEAMTPSIIKVVEFAKAVPGFAQLNVADQILLLKSCCMEIMCLKTASRYDPHQESLTLHNGMSLKRSHIAKGHLGVLVEPIFEFAIGLSKLQLDNIETSLLAAVLLMQSDRSGLNEPEPVEEIQDAILEAYKRYIGQKRPEQPVHWAKILMKVTDLRSISTRYAERVLCIRLDSVQEIPPLFLEIFNNESDDSNTNTRC